jgi:CheY-like chemotaxis protein
MNEYKPLTILIAEDNQDHAELMIDSLKEFNDTNTVMHVENGEQALSYLNNQKDTHNFVWQKPDIIFLDIKMPKLDGISALKAIKQNPLYKHIPVIMVTTSSAEHEIKECYANGASSYVTKPLQFSDFMRKMNELNLYWALTSELPH